MHAFIHSFIHAYTHTNKHTHITHPYVHAYIHTYIHAYIHTYIHTYTHTHTHIHTHTYTYIHTHTYIKQTAELYKIVRGKRHKNSLIDYDKPPKQWLHPAAKIIATDNKKEDSTPINIYTDGSKSEKGVGADIAIIRPRTPTVKLM